MFGLTELQQNYADFTHTFGEDVMSRATYFRWCKDFKKGREDPELQDGNGAPISVLSEVTFNTAEAMIKIYSRFPVRQLVQYLTISVGSRHKILKDHFYVLCTLDSPPKNKFV